MAAGNRTRQRGRNLIHRVLAVAVLVVAVAVPASARPGDYTDWPSEVFADFGIAPEDQLSEVVVAPDGSLYGAGWTDGLDRSNPVDRNVAVIHLHPDGTPDLAFGREGVAVIDPLGSFDNTVEELGKWVDHLRQAGLRGFIAEHTWDDDLTRASPAAEDETAPGGTADEAAPGGTRKRRSDKARSEDR